MTKRSEEVIAGTAEGDAAAKKPQKRPETGTKYEAAYISFTAVKKNSFVGHFFKHFAIFVLPPFVNVVWGEP